jgi:hypothetical protein
MRVRRSAALAVRSETDCATGSELALALAFCTSVSAVAAGWACAARWAATAVCACRGVMSLPQLLRSHLRQLILERGLKGFDRVVNRVAIEALRALLPGFAEGGCISQSG